ncbi:10a4455c-7e71-4261-a8fb-5f2d8e25d6c3-CDS [Sclerotinia trifoliorum]|uniref:10a4455c-7e71-4261-a8fb-5f2d8e25d6c3-CDS n=1 Tax=Sclerotinia trifoliorum TaxID=28548 RepID=A0A8H2VLC2_9HELO|nr:10a4455c-7e71-4261-a8fb-5f2d8e25d6c3-CDS [Sclerotinia trifoliorum]
MTLDIKKHYLDFEKAFHAPFDEMGSNKESDSHIAQSVSNALSNTFANSKNTHEREVDGYHPINTTGPTKHMEVDRGVLDVDNFSLNKSRLQTRRDELERERTDMNQLQVAWLEAVEALRTGKAWKGMNEKQKSAYDRAIRFRARSTTPHPDSYWICIEKYAARIFTVIEELEAVGISTQSADLHNILSKADRALVLPLEQCRRMDRRLHIVELLEIECLGPCGESKGFHQFSKDQRAKETNWCLECVKSKDITDQKEKLERAIARRRNDTVKIGQEPRKLWAPEVAIEVMQELTVGHTSVNSAHCSGALSGEDIPSKDSLSDIQTTGKKAVVNSGSAVNAGNTVTTHEAPVTDMKPTDTTPHPKETLYSQAQDIITNVPGVKASPTHLPHSNANLFQHQSFGMTNNNISDLAETHVGLANGTSLNHKYSTQDLEAMKEKELVTANTPMRECSPWVFAIENTLPCWKQAGFTGCFNLDGKLYSSITSPVVFRQLNDSGFSDKLLRALMTKSLQQQSVTIPLFPNNDEKWRLPRFILNGQLCERRRYAMQLPVPTKKRIPLVLADRDLDLVSDAEWKILAESESFSLSLAECSSRTEQASVKNEQKFSSFSHHVSDHYTELKLLQHSSPPKVPMQTDSHRTYGSELPHSPYYDTFTSLSTHAPSASLGIETQDMTYEARKKVLASGASPKFNEEQIAENAKTFNNIGIQHTEISPVAEACAGLKAHQKTIPSKVSPPTRHEQVGNLDGFDGYSASQYAKQRPSSSYYAKWEENQKTMPKPQNDFNVPINYFDSRIAERSINSCDAYEDEHRNAIYKKEEQNKFDATSAGSHLQDYAIRNLENRERADVKRQERESATNRESTEIVHNDFAKTELANTEVAVVSEMPVPTSPGELDAHTFTLDVAKLGEVPQAQNVELIITETNFAHEVNEDEYDNDAESEDSWTMAEEEGVNEFKEVGEWEML